MRGLRTNILVLLLGLLLLILAFPAGNCLADAGSRTGKIKAASLYYIAKFVTWPLSQAEQTQPLPELTLCVVGEDPLNDFIKGTASGKTSHGRRIAVRLFPSDADSVAVRDCDVLYLGEISASSSEKLLRSAHEKPVLTIRSVREVKWSNVVIQLFESSNKLNIAVDLPLALSKGLKISSELLRVSTVKGRE